MNMRIRIYSTTGLTMMMVAAGGCGGRTEVGSAQETSSGPPRWLDVCETMLTCDGLACIDGVCTQWCQLGPNACSAFGARAECMPRLDASGGVSLPPPGGDAPYQSPEFVCQMGCDEDADCDEGRRCHYGSCQVPSNKQPNGESCTLATECQSGYCAGMGCEPGEGTCVGSICGLTPAREMCTCDGLTIEANSETCPPFRYAHVGPCAE